MNSLFEQNTPGTPLAERMRPRSLDEVVGQAHLVAPGTLLRRLVESDTLVSLILWAPPGSGKTSLARAIAATIRSRFVPFSAVQQGVKDLREIAAEAAKMRALQGRKTVVFIDEIHRFSKTQQDALLPHLESGDLVLIGATTEPPSFVLATALQSRTRVFTLQSLTLQDLVVVLRRALTDPAGLADKGLGEVPEALLEKIAESAGGDARVALTTLETASLLGAVTEETVEQALESSPVRFDRGGEDHYNLASAMIKSIRGSDPDAALYYLARVLAGGEDPRFVARRLMISAAEDVGLADPAALTLSTSALTAVSAIGMPEARLVLAEVAVYLACAPKSNSAYMGIKAAEEACRQSGAVAVPLHLRNPVSPEHRAAGAGKGYLYAHDFPGGIVAQRYLPKELGSARFWEQGERDCCQRPVMPAAAPARPRKK